MRVALLQIRLDVSSRAANLARVVRLVDRACAADPSPDLLVLPEACDTGRVAIRAGTVTPAMAHAFAGALACKAREWGVFVAAGFQQSTADGTFGSAVLVDPDGDILIRYSRAGDADAAVRQTPLGTWGLCLASECGDDHLPERLAARGARLIIAPGLQSDEAARTLVRRCPTLSERLNVCMAVALGLPNAAPAVEPGHSSPIGSRLAGCRGRLLGECSPDGDRIVVAEVPADALAASAG